MDGSEGLAQPATKYNGSMQRIPTGITGLDTILHGGLLPAGLYLIVGRPGTGKTVLSNQIAFHHAAAGGIAVFVSVLAETHSRLFRNLSSLSFFDPARIAERLQYIGGYGVAQESGLAGLLAMLRGLINDNQATLLILDGLLNAEAFAPSKLAFKEFVHQLQVFAEYTGCTVLMLSSHGAGESAIDQVSVQTTVEGVIQMSRRREGMASLRELEVLKFRGSGFIEGGHPLRITSDGVLIYPRTEALLALSAPVHQATPARRERMAFGVARLDEMLHGGLLAGSTTMLLGPPGSGKTLLGLNFLAEGARLGQSALYYGLNEPPPALVDAGDAIGLDLGSYIVQGLLSILWQPAIESTLEVLADQLFRAAREHNVKYLFIDGLDIIADIPLYSERAGQFFLALSNELRSMGITTIISMELNNLFGPTVDIPLEGVSGVVDNVIFLRYAELRSQLYRLISVLKTRRSGYDTAIREFRIGDQGIEVADTFESAEAILTGVARPLPISPGRPTPEHGSVAPVVPPTQ